MKVKEIKLGRLVSGPGYSNRSAEVTIALSEDDSFDLAHAEADARVAQLLGVPSVATEAKKKAAESLHSLARKLDRDDDDEIPF